VLGAGEREVLGSDAGPFGVAPGPVEGHRPGGGKLERGPVPEVDVNLDRAEVRHGRRRQRDAPTAAGYRGRDQRDRGEPTQPQTALPECRAGALIPRRPRPPGSAWAAARSPSA